MQKTAHTHTQYCTVHLFFITSVRLMVRPQNRPAMKIIPIMLNATIMKYRRAGERDI